MACTDESFMAFTDEVSMEKNVGMKYRHCERGVKLFGVRLTDGMIRKSVSMGNLAGYSGSPPMHFYLREHSESAEGRLAADPQGYVSDGLVQNCGTLRERKKGVPWTEEEHRLFLVGLQKLGKGDWRGISRNFVPSRTPTQVASHAQKYFLRQSNLGKRRRRSSLFDIISTNALVSVDRPSCVVPPPMAIEDSPSFVLPHTSSHCSEPVGVSAELCLGLPTEQQQLQGQKPQRTLSEWKQPVTSTGPHIGFLHSSSTENKVAWPTVTGSTPARDFRLPTVSPFYGIDEVMEPSSSLRLNIAPPPLSQEQQPLELSLKLEQPAVSRHSGFHSSMPVAMVPKSSSTSLNAIRVV